LSKQKPSRQYYFLSELFAKSQFIEQPASQQFLEYSAVSRYYQEVWLKHDHSFVSQEQLLREYDQSTPATTNKDDDEEEEEEEEEGLDDATPMKDWDY
jgi:hypothetical protein